jgi:hypothetical protein
MTAGGRDLELVESQRTEVLDVPRDGAGIWGGTRIGGGQELNAGDECASDGLRHQPFALVR